jgi:uncharacterized protein (DUF1800 family)
VAADLTDAQLKHLLRRTEFVARPARVVALAAKATRSEIVDDILDIPVTVAIPAEVASGSWEEYIGAIRWWMNRMAFDSPKPIQEKMAFFWHGHFTSAYYKTNNLTWTIDQNRLFRDSALGNFRTLTQAMALQQQMLNYLDNDQNSKWSPNQNFARELLELFTLGIGNYQESDVEAAAKAWTGYTIDWWPETSPTHLQSIYDDSDHDHSLKTFMGTTADFNGPQIIDQLLVANATAKRIAARFIIGKLWKHFAGPVVPAAVLDALDDPFMADWNIKALVKAILVHPEFYSAASMELQVRSPVEWVVSVMVQSGLRCGQEADGEPAHFLHPEWYFEGMGQIPFNPPNVAGWKYNDYWVNTSTMGIRADFANHAAYVWRTVNSATYNSWSSKNATDLVASTAALFGLTPLSTTTETALKNYAMSEPSWWWRVPQMLQMGLIAPEMHVA